MSLANWRVKETASFRCTINFEHKIVSNLNFFYCYTEDKIINFTIYHTCMRQTIDSRGGGPLLSMVKQVLQVPKFTFYSMW